jgi:hypothetical protein
MLSETTYCWRKVGIMWVSFAVVCVTFFNLPLKLGLWQVCYVDNTVSTLPILTIKDILWTTTLLLHPLQYLHRQQPCFEGKVLFTSSEKRRVQPQGGSIHKIRGLGQDGSEVQPSILGYVPNLWILPITRWTLSWTLEDGSYAYSLRVRGILHLQA